MDETKPVRTDVSLGDAGPYFTSARLGNSETLLYWLIGLTVALAATALLVHIDIVATGAGQLSPEGYNTLMRSPREGLVKTVYVGNGAVVKAGARLLSFDCKVEEKIAASIAAQVVLADQALANQMTVARAILSKQQLSELDALYGVHSKSGGRAQGEAATRIQVMQREWQKIAVAQQQWSAQKAGLEAKLAAAATMATHADAQLSRQRDLRDKSYISAPALDQAQADALASAANREAAARELESLRADTNFNTSSDVLKSFSTRDTLYAALATAASTLSGLQTDHAKAMSGVQNCELLAPVDGQLFWLEDIRAGGWQKTGDALFKVVPTARQLVVEAQFKDADIAYLRPGQKAYIKIDGLPYIKYGTLSGVVQFVSPDTVNAGAYRATLIVDDPHAWALAKGVVLKAGLGITVDVVTGKRRLYEYFFEPLAEALRRSFQER